VLVQATTISRNWGQVFSKAEHFGFRSAAIFQLRPVSLLALAISPHTAGTVTAPPLAPCYESHCSIRRSHGRQRAQPNDQVRINLAKGHDASVYRVAEFQVIVLLDTLSSSFTSIPIAFSVTETQTSIPSQYQTSQEKLALP
jgi:hypothetical protein